MNNDFVSYIDSEEHILKLNKNTSLKYYNDEYFRKYVNIYVIKNNFKISLELYNCQNVTNVNMLGNVHTLNLNNCQNITDVGMLSNIHKLYLNCCPNITDVDNEIHTCISLSR